MGKVGVITVVRQGFTRPNVFLTLFDWVTPKFVVSLIIALMSTLKVDAVEKIVRSV
jgi:hypothetical protein